MRQLLSIRGLIILAVLFLSALPVYAIQHCHDYTVWVVTGNDANATPPNRLREILMANNYEIALTTTPSTPGADSKLRPGDVVFFGHAHSGVVNSQGRIDHFLQNMQQVGKHYDPAELPSLPNFYRGWTMVQFANLSREIRTYSDLRNETTHTVFPYRNMKVEVWRSRQGGGGQTSCIEAYKNCSACQQEKFQGRNLTGISTDKMGNCVATDLYKRKATDPRASEQLKACQKCLDGVRAGGRAAVTGAARSGTNTGGNGRTNNSDQDPGRRTSQYTPEQINNMRQWIAYYDNLIAQWTQYRDQKVAPYWNDSTYYRWARQEYQRCNQQIQLLQQYKAYYQNLLRQAGVQ